MHNWDPNSGSIGKNKNWFAIKVRDRFERRVTEGMEYKNIETFLPVNSFRRRWSDRVKTLDVPLFAGYAFCRIERAHRVPILTIPGVQYFVGAAREPAPVPDSEIESIRALLRSGVTPSPRPYLAGGEQVRIEDGPLRGVQGVLLMGEDGDQLVVSISLLQRSLTVTVDRDSVAALSGVRSTALCGAEARPDRLFL
jgi:transcriptional antiterminator NusG